MLSPTALSIACLALVAALLVADHLGKPVGRIAAKVGASSCFVLLALSAGAAGSTYGRFVLGALVLSWAGDVLLLSPKPAYFMAGLGSFLVAHVLFAAAFLSGPFSAGAAAIAFMAVLAFGSGVLRWLLPSTPSEFKAPVLAYVVVILAMCIAAASHSAATGRWAVLAGTVVFAASDLSVARDRFVRPGYVNRLWGWPAYYAAQVLLAWSAAAGASDA